MVVTENQLSALRKKLSRETIVFCGGVFDVFHIAHIRALKNLHKYGNVIVVGIVSDKRVRERKGPLRPILNQKERVEIVDELKSVGYVVQMPNSTKKAPIPTLEILKKLKPNVFVTVDRDWVKYKKEVNSLGVELKIVKRIHPTSSTSIIKRVLEQYDA